MKLYYDDRELQFKQRAIEGATYMTQEEKKKALEDLQGVWASKPAGA